MLLELLNASPKINGILLMYATSFIKSTVNDIKFLGDLHYEII